MPALRAVRDELSRHQLALNVVTGILAVYLAAGNLLRGAAVPSERYWAPGSLPFILLVICAIYVPVFALYKALDARFEEQGRVAAEAGRRSSELDRDLLVYCQQVVAELADRCPLVPLNQLAAQIWLCREDGSFDRRARFFLPHLRKSSGVTWRRGKGVAGFA